MKFAKSYFCSPNLIWVREILVSVRQVKWSSPSKIGFANLLFRQVALTRFWVWNSQLFKVLVGAHWMQRFSKLLAIFSTKNTLYYRAETSSIGVILSEESIAIIKKTQNIHKVAKIDICWKMQAVLGTPAISAQPVIDLG